MNRVCAVVVTYHPEPGVVENIRAVRRQVERLIVVDNEVTDESRNLLAALAEDPAVELVFNRENLGIATALNQGRERALSGDFDWLATFDQDSRAPDGFIAGLLAGYRAYAERERVAVLAPLYRDRNLGVVSSPSGPITGDPARETVISVTATSGNLVSTRALRAVGPFRDDFFIDCVDFDFCLRCRRQGWLVLEVRRVELDHAQGRFTQRRWLWRTPRLNDYSAVRRYYQARNRLIMYARFAAFDPRWILRDARGYASDLAKLLLFSERRPEKVRAVFTGFWHALIGKRGRWSQPRRT